MVCLHDGPLTVRWDYISEDEGYGSGWIVCGLCGGSLERMTYAGGTFRGRGRFCQALREQVGSQGQGSRLSDLQVD